MAIKIGNLKLELKFRDYNKRVWLMNKVTLIRILMIFAVLFLILFSIKPALAVELSKVEQAYLRSKETIRFVSQTRYPPFEFVGHDGNHTVCALNWYAGSPRNSVSRHILPTCRLKRPSKPFYPAKSMY